MTSYYGNNQDLMILEPTLIAPIGAMDFTSECGKWRNGSNLGTVDEHILWEKLWPQSVCQEQLIQNGTFAVTIYSHSWGQGLKC